jgi:hypothetical protein
MPITSTITDGAIRFVRWKTTEIAGKTGKLDFSASVKAVIVLDTSFEQIDTPQYRIVLCP